MRILLCVDRRRRIVVNSNELPWVIFIGINTPSASIYRSLYNITQLRTSSIVYAETLDIYARFAYDHRRSSPPGLQAIIQCLDNSVGQIDENIVTKQLHRCDSDDRPTSIIYMDINGKRTLSKTHRNSITR